MMQRLNSRQVYLPDAFAPGNDRFQPRQNILLVSSNDRIGA
jgi:hypothetical protein